VIHCFFRSRTKRVGALRRKLVSRGLLISTRQSRYRRYSLFFYLALARPPSFGSTPADHYIDREKKDNYNCASRPRLAEKIAFGEGCGACMRRVAGFRRALAKRNEAKAECRMKDGVDAQCDAQVQQYYSVVYMTGRPCEATRSTAPGQRVRGV